MFKNKIPRRIYGPVQKEICGTSGKIELQEMYKEPDVTAFRRSKILRWLGYICKREEDKMMKKLWGRKPPGVRPFGRSRNQWENRIKNHLTEMEVRTEEAQDKRK